MALMGQINIKIESQDARLIAAAAELRSQSTAAFARSTLVTVARATLEADAFPATEANEIGLGTPRPTSDAA